MKRFLLIASLVLLFGSKLSAQDTGKIQLALSNDYAFSRLVRKEVVLEKFTFTIKKKAGRNFYFRLDFSKPILHFNKGFIAGAGAEYHLAWKKMFLITGLTANFLKSKSESLESTAYGYGAGPIIGLGYIVGKRWQIVTECAGFVGSSNIFGERYHFPTYTITKFLSLSLVFSL
jgi:hypothetical protein